MELAILLQELMKIGWKAFGEFDKLMSYWQTRWIRDFWFWELWEVNFSLRELVSKESWLWQFVCENGMIKNANDYSWELYNWGHWQYEVYKNWYEWWKRWEQVDYEYRLIESALKDEDELDKFLLDNIKIS